MSDEREPLYGDKALELFFGGNPSGVATAMWATAMRNNYEARIAELEAEARQWREAYEAILKVADYEDTRITELEAQLAQTWQPLPINQVVQYNGEWPAMPAEYANDQLAICRLVSETQGEDSHE